MPTTADTLNVVYIAGYGRSGSTLLERILATHPAICGLGELAYLADAQLSDFYWEAAAGIPLWDQLEPALHRDEAETRRREQVQLAWESRRRGWWRWLFARPADEYRAQTLETFNAIRAALPACTQWMVDSSKTARDRFFRPFTLKRLPEFRVCMIHLVRDPRGSVQSVRRGSNAAMEQGRPAGYRLAVLRAAYGWTMANLAGLLFRLRYGSGSYIRIRYEDLADNPAACLRQLEPMLGVDFTHTAAVLKSERPVPPGDQFAGNRMRLESVIQLRNDQRWRTEMPRIMQWLVSLLCFPVALFAMRGGKNPVADPPEYQSAA